MDNSINATTSTDGPSEPTFNSAVLDDHDSAIGGLSVRNSVQSLAANARQYPVLYGRTYHLYKQGIYFLPNDKQEQERLDLQHELFLLTLDQRLFLAPIDNPRRVLDMCTGTGLWAIEIAERYPEAIVIGTDLSPIQPELIPNNLEFQLDDAEDIWTFSKGFNLIHWRMLFSCFQKPEDVIRSAFQSLKPNGYIELQDIVLPLQCIDKSLDGTALEEWNKLCIDAAKEQGRDWTSARWYEGYLSKAGFIDIVVANYKWPINTWPKDENLKTLGYWCQTNLREGIEGISTSLLTRAGIPKNQIDTLLENVKKDVQDRKIHAYVPVIVVYGRKPQNEV